MSRAARPAVDVVVPVAPRDREELAAVADRTRAVLGPRDALTVVDNRGVGLERPEVLVATAERSSYAARNAGWRRGGHPWVLFLDADVEPPADLLERYAAGGLLERADVGIVAGGFHETATPDDPAIVRYQVERGLMSQENTVGWGAWGFAQTANALVRRAALERVGGFREGIRSGGDADLAWRIRDAGWTLAPCLDAAVRHRPRRDVGALLRQKARHASGAAWLAREHAAVGAGPSPGTRAVEAARLAARSGRATLAGDREAAAFAGYDLALLVADGVGRLLPNDPLLERPATWPALVARALRRGSEGDVARAPLAALREPLTTVARRARPGSAGPGDPGAR